MGNLLACHPAKHKAFCVGGDNHGNFNGFASLSKKIGTSQSTLTDLDYVKEHSILKYFQKKLACYLHDHRSH